MNIPAKYVPSFEYYLIVEKDISDEVLDKLSNLIAAVVYLEKQNDVKNLNVAIEKVLKYIKYESIFDLKVFANWFTNMFRGDINPALVERIKDVTETKSMLTLLAEQLRNEGELIGIKKGIEKGIKKGKLEGELEGKLETAKKMKEKNFDVNLISEITGLSIEDIRNI